jgi:hypothetical protein
MASYTPPIGRVVKPPPLTGPGGQKTVPNLGWSSPAWGTPTLNPTSPVAHTPSNVLAPHQQPGLAPVALKGPPGNSGNSATTQTAPPGPSPLDSTYFANVANNNFQVGNKVNALNAQSGYAQTDLQNALAQLAYQEPRDQLKAEEAANMRGGLYSTAYNQQLGDLTHNYQSKQTDLTNAYTRKQGAIASEGNALWAGIPIYASGQAAAATVRAANANLANKGLGEPSKPLTPAQKTAAQTLAAAIVTAQHTGKPVRTQALGQTVITRPNGQQQATHTQGGAFGGTVRLTPAQQAALAALARGGK